MPGIDHNELSGHYGKMKKAIFLDLGGVLVEIAGEHEMRKLLGSSFSREQMWARWLASPAVRAHECGQISVEEFAAALVEEYEQSICANDFIASFHRWIVGSFSETHQLLTDIKARVTIALLTNTCAAHWPQIEATGVPAHFKHIVASHQIGKLKPDLEYFIHALDVVGINADEAIFFDDNEINCVGARKANIEAFVARNPSDVRNTLIELNIMPQ